MVGLDLSVPPAASFEWKWLIEIFIFETHVTPPAKHGMVSSANCSPVDEENNFRPVDQILLRIAGGDSVFIQVRSLPQTD